MKKDGDSNITTITAGKIYKLESFSTQEQILNRIVFIEVTNLKQETVCEHNNIIQKYKLN